MSSSLEERRARAEEAVLAEASVPALLQTAARHLVAIVEAAACSVSRLVGEVLIEVVEHSLDGRTLSLGQGYLVPDYPLTQKVLEEDTAQTVSLLDPEPDPTEARLLREIGYESLLMVPLSCEGSRWGLAEIYTSGRAFSEEETARARALADLVSEKLEQLPAAGA